MQRSAMLPCLGCVVLVVTLVSTVPSAALAQATPAVAADEDLDDPLEPAPAEPEGPPVRKGLMIAGWSVFGSSYLLTAMVGALLLERSGTKDYGLYTETCTNCNSTGPYLFIPVVGPFLALPNADGTDGKVVCAGLGLVQAAGLVMAIVGTSQFVSDRRAYQAWQRGQVTLGERWFLTASLVPVNRHAVPALGFGGVF